MKKLKPEELKEDDICKASLGNELYWYIIRVLRSTSKIVESKTYYNEEKSFSSAHSDFPTPQYNYIEATDEEKAKLVEFEEKNELHYSTKENYMKLSDCKVGEIYRFSFNKDCKDESKGYVSKVTEILDDTIYTNTYWSADDMIIHKTKTTYTACQYYPSLPTQKQRKIVEEYYESIESPQIPKFTKPEVPQTIPKFKVGDKVKLVKNYLDLKGSWSEGHKKELIEDKIYTVDLVGNYDYNLQSGNKNVIGCEHTSCWQPEDAFELYVEEVKETPKTSTQIKEFPRAPLKSRTVEQYKVGDIVRLTRLDNCTNIIEIKSQLGLENEIKGVPTSTTHVIFENGYLYPVKDIELVRRAKDYLRNEVPLTPGECYEGDRIIAKEMALQVAHEGKLKAVAQISKDLKKTIEEANKMDFSACIKELGKELENIYSAGIDPINDGGNSFPAKKLIRDMVDFSLAYDDKSKPPILKDRTIKIVEVSKKSLGINKQLISLEAPSKDRTIKIIINN